MSVHPFQWVVQIVVILIIRVGYIIQIGVIGNLFLIIILLVGHTELATRIAQIEHLIGVDDEQLDRSTLVGGIVQGGC